MDSPGLATTPRRASRFAVVGNHMKHFSCDVCGRELGDGAANRYVVRIEVYAAPDDTPPSEEELDSDPLDIMDDLLSDLDDDELDNPSPPPGEMRYDLCPTCHARFVRNPLNRDRLLKFNFSKN